MKHRRTYPAADAGFSLVEVALALMVVSIGLVSLVGLLPASLEMNKKAIDDSQMGLLAEDILKGYKAKVRIGSWSQWNSTEVEGTASDIWDNPSLTDVQIGVGSVVYKYTSPQASGGSVTIEDLSARYDLDVQTHPIDGKLLSCRLDLRPGEFGATNALTFYTEMYSTDLTWE